MNSIKCLKINDNGLRNFANIQRLYKMQHLFANSNRINDFPDIDKLLELPNLKELELNGNPLCRRPGYRQILLKKLTPLLYLDGKVRFIYDDSQLILFSRRSCRMREKELIKIIKTPK